MSGEITLSAKRWRLETFGHWRVVELGGENRVFERIHTRKTASLVALLAVASRAVRREELCLHLWPDAAPDSARNSLSASLSALRRELGDDAVCADRYVIELNREIWECDWNDFEKALQQAQGNDAEADAALETLLRLYRGRFLPGFDEEPLLERARSSENALREVFACHLKLREASSNAEKLSALAERALELFPREWDWHYYALWALEMRGQTDAALRAYEGLQRAANRAGEPTPDNARALAKRLRNQLQNPAIPAATAPASPEPKPSVAVPVATNNLPPTWTRFFGRTGEMTALTATLRVGEKLVTLSGAGGTGKTRLALEVARQLTDDFQSVYFVSLAPLFDTSLLIETIRENLAIPGAPDVSPLQQLVSALRGQSILLLLDNFEQLVDGGAAELQKLREALPDATFLVTSRQTLHLPGERVFEVPPLRASEGVTLFLDRTGGKWDDETHRPNLLSLCAALDGLPLAIELAAARARVLSPTQILERLEKRLDFLAARGPAMPERHRTLRATIEWSVDLLEKPLHDFWSKLSVFRGGWTLEAVEAISNEWEALDYLETLRDHSLVVAEETKAGVRFRLLEMLREWGETQLDAPQTQALRQQHFDYYLGLLEANSSAQVLAVKGEELEAELANFRSALSFALSAETPVESARFAVALGPFWEARTLNSEGREWCERVLTKVGATPEKLDDATRSQLLRWAGAMHWYCGSYTRAIELLDESLELSRALGDEAGEAYALDYKSKVLGVTGDPLQERIYGQQVMAYARKHNDIPLLMSSLATTSWGCLNCGYGEEAVAYLDEGAALGRQFGVARMVATCTASKPFALMMLGRFQEAYEASQFSFNNFNENAGAWGKAFVRGSAGIIGLAMGDIETARRLLPESTRDFYNITTRWELASVLSECGNLAVALGQYERAALIYGANEALRERSGHVMLPCLQPSYNANLAKLQGAVDESTLQSWWQRGQRMSFDELFEEIEHLKLPEAVEEAEFVRPMLKVV